MKTGDFLFADKETRCPSIIPSWTKSIHLKDECFKSGGITVKRIGVDQSARSGQRKDPIHKVTVSRMEAPSNAVFEERPTIVDSQKSIQCQSEAKVVPSRIPYPSRQPAEVQVKSTSRWRTELHSAMSRATPRVLVRSGIPRPGKSIIAFHVREAKIKKRLLVLPLSLPDSPCVTIRATYNFATPTSQSRSFVGITRIIPLH